MQRKTQRERVHLKMEKPLFLYFNHPSYWHCTYEFKEIIFQYGLRIQEISKIFILEHAHNIKKLRSLSGNPSAIL
jgi:hypothetical protein